jgi:hypothetical protein
MGTPLAAYGGVCLANMRARRIHFLPADGAWTAYDVELKARYYLHAALYGHAFEESGRLGARSTSVTSGGKEGTEQDGVVDLEGGGGGAAAHSALDLDGHDGANEIMALARSLLTPKQLAVVSKIFSKGCDKFRSSAIMHIFVARFHHVFTRNKHLHMRWVETCPW